MMPGPGPTTLKEAYSYACSTARTISSGNGAWAGHGPPTRSCRRLSKKSFVCLIEWRPSGLLCASLLGLGLLAVLSIGLSALPVALKWVLAPACLVHAV